MRDPDCKFCKTGYIMLLTKDKSGELSKTPVRCWKCNTKEEKSE